MPGLRPGLGLAALLSLVLAAAPPSPARAEGADHPGTGTLLLDDRDGTLAAVEALLLDTRLALDVRGLLGELTLTQTFRNTTDRWLDGTYLFPLPDDAAVRGLELRVGERTVIGRVMEREEARATFETARDTGQVAGLVERQRPDLFTARLASVPPGGEIRVALDVLLAVRADDERLSVTLPTTLTPRYANAHAPGADALDGPVVPARGIRGPRLSLEARIRPLADLELVESASHRLAAQGDRLVLDDVPMDRDLELAWPFAGGTSPLGEAYGATHHGERYVQLFMAPPDARAVDAARTPRELVLVVDRSGSMAGVSIAAARTAARSALDGLGPDDTFDLIAFDDETRALFDGPRPASGANLAAARRFVRRLSADGGTEMAPALARAFTPTTRDADRETDVERLRQVVFLTDGSIADEDRLLRLIRRDVGSARLFTVGIGSAPNTWFLAKAAELGRGTALAIRDVDDVQEAVTALLGRLERPVLTGIEVQFPGGAESYPTRVPDLYADSPLMVVARLDRTGGGRERLRTAVANGAAVPDADGVVDVEASAIEPDAADAGRVAIVTGWMGEERFVRRIPLPDLVATAASVPDAPSIDVESDERRIDRRRASDRARDRARDPANGPTRGSTRNPTRDAAPAFAMRWARAKVTALLDEQRESPDTERHRDEILALALDVGLVTPYTSFVAVEAAPVRPAGADRADAEVANLLPEGNEMLDFALPRGAAGIDTLGWVSLLSGSLGTALLWFGRRVGRARRRGAGAASPDRVPLDTLS